MNLPEILTFHRAQCRKSWVWAIVAALSITDFLGAAVTSSSWNSHPWWWLGLFLLEEFVTMLSAVLLGPLAWLWSGSSGTFPRFRKGLLQVIAMGVACAAIIVCLEWGLQAIHPRPHVLPGLWKVVKFSVPGYMTLFCLGGFGIAAYEREHLARNEAEHRAQEAQWILLKEQMNPHVFLNAMNSLAELIRKDSSLAEQAVMNLSDLFRRFAEHGQSHLIPLRDERLLVESYLGIERLRLGQRLQVDWDWEAPLDNVMAPPFLILPLVENAIKHALAPHPPGGLLKISGSLQGGRVHLQVGNTGKTMGPRHSGGSGLDNLEARLRQAFEEDGSFQLTPEGSWTLANVWLPLLAEGL